MDPDKRFLAGSAGGSARHEELPSLVSMDITDAAVSLPKTARKGYEHAFRLDLSVKPTEGWKDTKYIVAVSSDVLLQQYVLPSASRSSTLSQAHAATVLSRRRVRGQCACLSCESGACISSRALT